VAVDKTIKDSVTGGWVERSPASVRPYLRLSRYDRPIGFWLLALPGWTGLAFAGLTQGYALSDFKWAALIAIGAVAMRGAGCTYNDIIDRDLDAQVERTALRPLPAGSVTVKQAWVWLTLQCLVGLAVLAFFPRLAQIIALSSLALVAAYPFMKRVTYWPQAWLGLTFNWAVLVAYVAKTGQLGTPLFLLYAGLVFWTIGYDTIYACQDTEDDALIGVKSTARLFGSKTRFWLGTAYGLCSLLLAMAIYAATKTPFMVFTAIAFVGHLVWQMGNFKQSTTLDCPDYLGLFKSNRTAALLLILGLAIPSLANMLHLVR